MRMCYLELPSCDLREKPEGEHHAPMVEEIASKVAGSLTIRVTKPIVRLLAKETPNTLWLKPLL